MKDIFSDKIFYHIYPLGLSGAPLRNDFSCAAGDCFQKLTGTLDSLVELGINALYIGPVFESTAHGYDTVDYYHVERRLGNNQSFKDFCHECHSRGIAVVLDAVFNHTGRDFFAFKDIQANGSSSQYRDWYLNLDFNRSSSMGDCFDYQGWAGCMDLVKLNVDNQDVRNHLFGAVKFWIEEFGIDGLRLDAADVLSKDFLDALGQWCRSIKSDFWLMGEVVHGDYNQWAREGRIDSVTNYQIYKALWSSLNDKNFYELSYNLDREFGSQGIYRYAPLYNFLDNHDVDRIASTISEQRHLYLVYGLLFTIPGIPSIYYGSQWGIRGKRNSNGDRELRPCLPPFADNVPDFARPQIEGSSLKDCIKRFAIARKNLLALQKGDYSLESISNTQFAFRRSWQDQEVVVCVNSEDMTSAVKANLSGCWVDELDGTVFTDVKEVTVPGCWLRILVRR